MLPPLRPTPEEELRYKGTNKWLAGLGVGMGLLMSTLDSSSVNVALPTMVRELGTTFAVIQWVVVAYLLIVTALMPAAARLGDIRGRKQMYQLGMGFFAVGSLLCAIAPNTGWLIFFRALQGIGDVMISALAIAIVTDIFPDSQRGQAVGINSMLVSLGIMLGPVIGGFLVGAFGWRSIFLINVPVGIVAMIIVQKVIPQIPRLERQKFDVPGGLLVFAGLAAYALGMTFGQDNGFATPWVLVLIIGGLLLIAAFVVVELRVPYPMVNLRLFGNPVFSTNLLMRFLIFVVMTTSGLLIPFYLELVQGRPVTQIGWMMLAQPLSMGIFGPLSGALSDRFGTRGISLIGLILVFVGAAAISTVQPDSTVFEFMIRLAPIGMGLGMFHSPNNSAVIGSAPPELRGTASGLLALARTMAQTSGTPLMGALFFAQAVAFAGLPLGTGLESIPADALDFGFRMTFRIVAATILVTVVIGLIGTITQRRDQKPAPVVENLAAE
ncbi:MAG: MFS transporter [Anaerolineae bacterium]|nr:MFS transporter [Anaerolineae bacterium]